MAQVTYTEGQSFSYEAEGSLYRDISDVLTNIDPDKTPFLSNIPDGEDVHEMKFEWQLDHLRAPKKNQRPEFDTYTFEKAEGVGRMSNACQIFRVDGMVSDVMQKAWKTYNPKTDELARIIGKRTKELAKDMEYALMVNATSTTEIGSTLAMTGGIPFFMKAEVIATTINTATSELIAATAHHLETGKWVYFRPQTGSTLPTEIDPNREYYIRCSAATPATVFTIFESEEDAIENINPVNLTAATVTAIDMLINNVVDAGDAPYTLDNIKDAVKMAMMRGGEATDAWMSPSNKSRLSTLLSPLHTTTRTQTDHRVDEVVTTYMTDFGTVNARVHPNLKDGNIYVLDPSYWRLRWFDRAHIIPDEKLAKTGSFQKFVATATFGLEGTQPLASASVANITRS